MSVLPLDAAGKRPAFFDEPGMDQLLSMMLELAAELWVVKERVFVLESVLGQQGIAARDAVEAYVPTPEEQQTLAAMRATMTAQLFRTLARDHRPVNT
jgi:hypothetical protein